MGTCGEERKGKKRLFIVCSSGWQPVTVLTEAKKLLQGGLELEGKGATLPRMWQTESAPRAK